MTQENILDQAKKLVGMAYGWGDSNGDMDCSSTMNAIYQMFWNHFAKKYRQHGTDRNTNCIT